MIVMSAQQEKRFALADRERFYTRASEVLERLHGAVPGTEMPPPRQEVVDRTAFCERLGYLEESHLLILLAVFTVFRGVVSQRELGPAVREVVGDEAHESAERVHGLVLMLPSELQQAILKYTPWPAF